MIIPRALFVLVYLKCVCSNQTAQAGSDPADVEEMEYSEGTSVEAKYLLPPVNVSVSGNASIHTVRASLARVLDFYNTELLAANWGRFKGSLSEGCRKDMDTYIQGLGRAENWALKMDDASGRYSTGWFWGNIYWMGSQSLCAHITPKKQIIVDSQNHSRSTRAAAVSLKPQSPSAPLGYNSGPAIYTSAPFPLSFFMLRLHLNSSFTTEERILHFGLCLPLKCTDEDVKRTMEETSKSSQKITVKVEAVKSEHNRYNMWGDRTFIILCVVTSIVVVLLVIATLFDLYLGHQKKRNKNSHFSTKLDMSMPDIKTKNGKCSLYVVNNNNEVCINGDDHLQSQINIGMILKEVLLSFSLKANLKSICDQTVGSDTIPVLHGLKAISMAWVILGHTCIIAFKYSDNMEYRKVVEKEFMFQTISNGTFSVDTFFFTSGLLVSFLYFRSNAKGKLDPLTNGKSGLMAGLLHFVGLIGYRFARLTAPYLFTIGVVEVSMKWFYYNSVFEPPAMDHVNCPNYWWRNVLYINTLFPAPEMCMLWSWYLSDDTQFYIIGAIMLILAASHFKSAAALLVVFLASSWMTTGYIAYSNRHMPGSDDPLALFDKIYDKPWTRLGPYLIGMCTGWLLFKKNCRIRMSKLSVTVGWTASVACLLSLVYGLYETRLTPSAGAAYSALSHSAWAVGLSWIVVACCTGYGGIVNKILSATILYPFSRVTYCAYLLHPIIIRVMVMSMDSPLHLGTIVTLVIYMGQVVASYAISFLLSVAFEAPVVSMLRIISKVVAIKKSQSAASPS
ncbi:nose resistant to fluoxetine protein 6-like isoform X2 [Anoplophora glabripennis]|uniref:nose resistant to fluoxetine protein 6-like isoform X2 n=1 Tax=Anoplophora glabripennis TaxID=217634 RepID=UPI000873E175|nr:nose resistant to fluoxetine protein 6-like isoform X2 [Anoplophora glabripennis]